MIRDLWCDFALVVLVASTLTSWWATRFSPCDGRSARSSLPQLTVGASLAVRIIPSGSSGTSLILPPQPILTAPEAYLPSRKSPSSPAIPLQSYSSVSIPRCAPQRLAADKADSLSRANYSCRARATRRFASGERSLARRRRRGGRRAPSSWLLRFAELLLATSFLF